MGYAAKSVEDGMSPPGGDVDWLLVVAKGISFGRSFGRFLVLNIL